MRMGDWKVVQPKPDAPLELYNLQARPRRDDQRRRQAPGSYAMNYGLLGDRRLRWQQRRPPLYGVPTQPGAARSGREPRRAPHLWTTFGSVTNYARAASSTYHSMQFSRNKRLTQNFTLLTSLHLVEADRQRFRGRRPSEQSLQPLSRKRRGRPRHTALFRRIIRRGFAEF